MKKSILISVFAAIVCHADVTITNLAVAQRPGTKLMDITYDVSSATTNTVTISLTVSNGATKVSATNLTGAVGTIQTGAAKSIAWNMETDWNTNVATLSFSVWGHDGDYPAPVSKTGQTISYATYDDGSYQKGVAWPNPRFTVQANTNCVLDNLTGLIWARNANLGGAKIWSGAITYCENLTYGGQTDWRLPNVKELESLFNCESSSPALPAEHPFAGVQGYFYWSGTSFAFDTGRAWVVDMGIGYVFNSGKADNFPYVWPVRGGQ